MHWNRSINLQNNSIVSEFGNENIKLFNVHRNNSNSMDNNRKRYLFKATISLLDEIKISVIQEHLWRNINKIICAENWVKLLKQSNVTDNQAKNKILLRLVLLRDSRIQVDIKNHFNYLKNALSYRQIVIMQNRKQYRLIRNPTIFGHLEKKKDQPHP